MRTRGSSGDPKVAEEPGGSPEIILEIRRSFLWILGPRLEPGGGVGIQRFYDRSEDLVGTRRFSRLDHEVM